MAEPQTTSPREAAEQVRQRGARLIDVRTPAEFREMHAIGAENRPLDALDPAALIASSTPTEDQPLYVICRSGSRGAIACRKLIDAGCEHVVNVEGGSLAWDEAGLPVQRGKKAISLERQVRIAAGSLVLVGVALGAMVSPYAYGLSAFVGAGLVVAGVTDTCGMGMLLAKAPWNQVRDEPGTACAVPRPSA